MGCDIHVFGETKNAEGSYSRVDVGDILYDRNYAVFGFLAGVRNYSDVEPISEPRGIPDDACPEVAEEVRMSADHSYSWLTLAELRAFDYDAMTEDRRVTRQIAPGFYDGRCTANAGEGKKMTYREFLGSHFFNELDRLDSIGVCRIVFGFDS